MGEIKSVKVDNWGVFFLQKLQNFFNKTDYCDLTLQFRDNSQLKVHRLVLSACTDYFNVLEQTCEVVDDALIMPNELQADVVVPIVNFMYTGTLEFELKMYGKLLRTAKEMNMTVLLKLLEAHRRTMEGVNRSQRPPSPKAIRRRGPPNTNNLSPSQNQQQRRILTPSNASQQQQRRIIQNNITNTNAQQTQNRQQAGTASILKSNSPGDNSTYDAQVKQEVIEYETSPKQPSSPFEQLRKGYNNNKRPASTTFVSPPAKKPNIEDVKEFAEQQRMRKQIAAEYGDDQEYEGMLDDDIHNYDDDEDTAMATSSNAAQTTPNRQQQQQQQGATAMITFKHEQGDRPPSIVIKDNTNSKMNHAKIISEVLRQYPHLVKSNKNIKLKIMPSAGGQAQKIILKKDSIDHNTSTQPSAVSPHQQQQQSQQQLHQQQPQQQFATKIQSQTVLKPIEKVTQTITSNSVAQKLIAVGTSISTSALAATTSGSTGPSIQKRRIDSKTMHALIALGAENTTGPWLCLRCGVSGRPISIPSYRGFRRHLINTHKEAIDNALCENCGWRSPNNRRLHFHMQVEHKVKSTLYTFPECLMCAEIFFDNEALIQHMTENHPEDNKQQCIYCNKIVAKEQELYTHMKTYHQKQALEDGIIDYSDEEFIDSQDETESEEQSELNLGMDKKDSKVKIISDISLPVGGSILKLEPSSEADALNTVASGIATSIGIRGAEEFMSEDEAPKVVMEPKFVNAEGNEVLLTDEQRREIMAQLNQDHEGVVMVLTDPADAPAELTEQIANEDEMHVDPEEEVVKSKDEDGGEASENDEYDDSQIYSEFTSQATATVATVHQEVGVKKSAMSNLDESKESIENLEWAENLISAHDLEDEANDGKKLSESKVKTEDEISSKLKELTGDWSEDEIEEEEIAGPPSAPLATNETKSDDLTSSDNNKEPSVQHNIVEEEKEVETEESTLDNEKDVIEEIEATEEGEKTEDDDDDDIDRAMKSLHKDDIIETVGPEPQDVDDGIHEDDINPKDDEGAIEMNTDSKDEIMEVDVPSKENEDKKDKIAELKEIEDIGIKDGEVNVSEEIKDDKPDKEIPIEDEDSKKLLAELISESNDSKIEEETIGEEREEFIEETKLETALEVESTDIKEDKETVVLQINAPELSVAKDDAIASTTLATDEFKKATIEPDVVASTTTSNTEKVKSIISEWAEDDDDDAVEEDL